MTTWRSQIQEKKYEQTLTHHSLKTKQYIICTVVGTVFFSTNTCGSNPRTVTNPKTTRVFIPPSWTLSCSRNSKRASLLISSWSNHWVTSGNRKLKNLGPEAMGWIDDGSLMVVDGRFCRIFSHGRSWKSRIFGWPLVSMLSPMEVLPVICQQKAFLPNEAGLGHELVT